MNTQTHSLAPQVEMLRIRSALAQRGHNLSSWARANHYGITMVQNVVRRVVYEPDTPRHGVITLRILADLTRDLGKTIVPGIAPSPPQSDPDRKAA